MSLPCPRLWSWVHGLSPLSGQRNTAINGKKKKTKTSSGESNSWPGSKTSQTFTQRPQSLFSFLSVHRTGSRSMGKWWPQLPGEDAQKVTRPGWEKGSSCSPVVADSDTSNPMPASACRTHGQDGHPQKRPRKASGPAQSQGSHLVPCMSWNVLAVHLTWIEVKSPPPLPLESCLEIQQNQRNQAHFSHQPSACQGDYSKATLNKQLGI